MYTQLWTYLHHAKASRACLLRSLIKPLTSSSTSCHETSSSQAGDTQRGMGCASLVCNRFLDRKERLFSCSSSS